MEKSENFKNWWSGIQSIVTIVVMILGLFWTVHTFSALRQKATADTQLAEAQQRLEDLKYKEGALDFEMNASDERIPNDSAHYIEVTVRIKNIGNQDVLMCFEDPDGDGKSNCDKDVGDPCKAESNLRPLRSPIVISRAIFKSDSLNFGNDPGNVTVPMYRDDCPQHEVSEIRVQAGQTEWYTAVARVPKSGLYRISFFSYITKLDRNKMSVLEANTEPSPSHLPLPTHGRPYWSATTFLTVGGTPKSTLRKTIQ
jgi:hypothetical protein